MRRFILLAIATFPFIPSSVIAQEAKLPDQKTIEEVVRYLYRWYWDEAEVAVFVKTNKVEFEVRTKKVDLDTGDNSQFAEVRIPQTSTFVLMKSADYTIEETGERIKSEGFRILAVGRYDAEAKAIDADKTYTQTFDELKKNARAALKTLTYPEGKLLESLREAARDEVTKNETILKNLKNPEGPHIIHVSPFSPVANELWLYWENGRCLIHFSSDRDLSQESVWRQKRVDVRVIYLKEQLVVSHLEKPGSNAFMTRDQAARAIFNCTVLGKKIELAPRAVE